MNRREDGRIGVDRLAAGPSGTFLGSDGMVPRWQTPASGGMVGSLWVECEFTAGPYAEGANATPSTITLYPGTGSADVTTNGTTQLTFGAGTYIVSFGTNNNLAVAGGAASDVHNVKLSIQVAVVNQVAAGTSLPSVGGTAVFEGSGAVSVTALFDTLNATGRTFNLTVMELFIAQIA